jgi:hypothetical protein
MVSCFFPLYSENYRDGKQPRPGISIPEKKLLNPGKTRKSDKKEFLGSPGLPGKDEKCPFQFATQHLYCVIAVCFSVFLPSWCELAKQPSADTAWMM